MSTTDRNTVTVRREGLPVVRDDSGKVLARGTSLLESSDQAANAAYVRTVIHRPRAHVVIDGLLYDAPTSRTTSRTAAKRQAHQESSMYRQGSGWIVSTWDDGVSCHRVTGELPYRIASTRLAEWRRDRKLQLLRHAVEEALREVAEAEARLA